MHPRAVICITKQKHAKFTIVSLLSLGMFSCIQNSLNLAKLLVDMKLLRDIALLLKGESCPVEKTSFDILYIRKYINGKIYGSSIAMLEPSNILLFIKSKIFIQSNILFIREEKYEKNYLQTIKFASS